MKESEGNPKVSYVTVFERPGLHEFLKGLGEFADLVLFTAGLEGLVIIKIFTLPSHMYFALFSFMNENFCLCPQVMLDHLLTE